MAGRRKLLLLLKPFDVYPAVRPSNNALSPLPNPQILNYLDHRRKVHRKAISFCQNILQRKPVDWELMMRNDLSRPICNVDLVVTVGGDGTLLQASHFMDDSVPVLGVNSDPTKAEEVEEFSNKFDATRSTGYLCASTIGNFEQILDEVLEGRSAPSELSRLSIQVNAESLPSYALNDILIAHPCPAAVSRFSFRIKNDAGPCSPIVNCRSSGLRVSTAAGSTAAMLSAGGVKMPILSRDIQYMVREPILPGASSSLMRGFVKPGQSMGTSWFCKEGVIYIDGSHECHQIKHGDTIEISTKAPVLRLSYLSS
ncbi:hypothetical protein CRG98_019551 [Punica granatum]|uniref:NADH kinase n=1 Tax=Punica granatum TaxID=22663 RepID=A0A2I0JX68_PUNGR|nr:hypothetical protein CRG98_019551 [Punica granatum]